MQKLRQFLPILTATLLSLTALIFPIGIISCNGNGGTSDMYGDVYTPGGTAANDSGSTGGMDAIDILNMTNSGDIESIVANLTGAPANSGTDQSQLIVLDADAIGLPAGGTATLTITGGGVNYSETAGRIAGSRDVTFKIPPLLTGSELSVSLTIRAADGTVLYAGGSTQTISGDEFQMDIRLTRQFWTLPASLTVTASPASLLYDTGTWDTVSATFSISGLEDAPAGAAISYRWEDAAAPGNAVGTGPSLTMTVHQLLGSTAPAGELTKTLTVTASYTDTAGETKTASGSASVTIGGPVDLPDFTIGITPPACTDASRSTADAWAITNLTDKLTFTVAGTFPASTSFAWTVGGTAFPAQTGQTCEVSPSDLGYDVASIGNRLSPTAIPVSCIATNDRAAAPKAAAPASANVFFVYLVPDFTVTASPDGLVYNASTWTSASTTFSFPAFTGTPPGGSFSYSWTDESGNPVTPAAADGSLTQTVFQLLGGTATAADDLTRTFTVTATFTDAGGVVTQASSQASVIVGGPVELPEFSVVATAPASKSDAESTTDAWALTNLTDKLTFTATPASGSFPAGTTFEWHAGPSLLSQTGETCELSPEDLGYSETSIGTKASPSSVTISCTATNSRATAPKDGTGATQQFFLVHFLPDFTVQVAPPATSDTTKSSGTTYALADLTSGFTLTPVSSGAAFPTGTTFEWTVQAGSLAAYSPAATALGSSCSVTPAQLGLTATGTSGIGRTAATATPISISCTAKNPHATDKAGTPNNATKAFLLYTLPAFTIDVSVDASAYHAANSDLTGTVPLYALINMGKDFTFTVNPGASSFPAGTEFTWKVNDSTLTGATQKGSSISISTSAMGLTSTQGLPNSISTSKDSPTSIPISCTAKHESALANVDGTDTSVSVFWLTIPDFKITMTAPTGLETVTSGENTVYLVTDADMSSVASSRMFNFKAELKNGTDSWPSGVTYTWSFNGTPSSSDSAGATAGGLTTLTAAPESETPATVTCTANIGTILEKDAESSVTVRIKKGLSVDDLSSYISSLPPGSKSAPNVIPPIIGLTSSTNLKTAITDILQANRLKYIDLSATQLPDGINMEGAFFKELSGAKVIPNLIKAPKLPASVTAANDSLSCIFSTCTNLAEAPEIPEGVKSLNAAFQWCYSLTTAPEIPDSAEILSGCFDHGSGTSSLTHGSVASPLTAGRTAITIPDGVTNMFKCFNNCTALQDVDIIVKGTSVTDWTKAFQGIDSATQHVTVQVPNYCVKQAIESAAGNGSVNIVVSDGSTSCP